MACASLETTRHLATLRQTCNGALKFRSSLVPLFCCSRFAVQPVFFKRSHGSDDHRFTRKHTGNFVINWAITQSFCAVPRARLFCRCVRSDVTPGLPSSGSSVWTVLCRPPLRPLWGRGHLSLRNAPRVRRPKGAPSCCALSDHFATSLLRLRDRHRLAVATQRVLGQPPDGRSSDYSRNRSPPATVPWTAFRYRTGRLLEGWEGRSSRRTPLPQVRSKCGITTPRPFFSRCLLSPRRHGFRHRARTARPLAAAVPYKYWAARVPPRARCCEELLFRSRRAAFPLVLRSSRRRSLGGGPAFPSAGLPTRSQL